jgi:hypothetical protein
VRTTFAKDKRNNQRWQAGGLLKDDKKNEDEKYLEDQRGIGLRKSLCDD